MSFWDPVRARSSLVGQSGFIASELSIDVGASTAIGETASSQVGTVVEAGLVSCFDRAKPLLPRCIDWIDLAVQRGELMAGETVHHHRRLLVAKALALWLWRNDPAQDLWSDVFDRRLASMRANHPDLSGRYLHEALDDLMAFAYQSGRFAEGLSAYAEFHAAPVSALKPSRVSSPRQFAALLCAQGNGAGFAPAALDAAGHRMLQKHLAEDWLHNGRMLRTAMWLKIVHWLPDGGLSPEQVLLKAYDDMPTIPRPAFVDAS